jgi:hypothetical protein
LPKLHNPSTDQSFVKELAKPTQEKLFLKNVPTLQKNKKRYAQPDSDRQKSKRTMTLKLNTDNGLQRRTDRTPAANMRLASCGVTVVNSSAVFQFNFSAGLTVLCPEIPHERKAAERYAAL